jgi:hypothetical protein
LSGLLVVPTRLLDFLTFDRLKVWNPFHPFLSSSGEPSLSALPSAVEQFQN